ncbi:MAG: NADH-quinone oxidoreductase subunit C [Acidimicrobiales bacterium]
MSDEAPAEGAEEAEAAPPAELPTRYGVAMTEAHGQVVLHPRREGLDRFVMELRDEHGFNVCIDVTAVDHLTHQGTRTLPAGIEPERFELVVALLSHANRERVRLRVQVPESEASVPSLFEVHPGTEALEREVYDMFGITFDGHPDLTRILMPEDWVGHPLRKDYAIGRIPVQFKGASNVR